MQGENQRPQKWTAEEEEALLAGVAKHGEGMWKIILEDPEFGSILAHRSNRKLKDKWRRWSTKPSPNSPSMAVEAPQPLKEEETKRVADPKEEQRVSEMKEMESMLRLAHEIYERFLRG